jgi:GxxExxY protein
MSELLYPELSYKIVGILFEVYNALGSGYQEKYYQKALEREFASQKIIYKSQLPVRLKYKGDDLGIYYLDFLIENKIVLEIKIASKFYPRDIKQVLGYLRVKDVKLGILACFSRNGLVYKRILKGN